MVEIDFSEKEIKQKKNHNSYHYNLFKSKEFIQRTFPDGMRVKLCDSDGLKDSLLMFSHNHSKKGRWANPVFLHQDAGSFLSELNAAEQFYKKMTESDPENASNNRLNGD